MSSCFRHRWVPHLPGLVRSRYLCQHTWQLWVWMFWGLRERLHDDEELHGQVGDKFTHTITQLQMIHSVWIHVHHVKVQFGRSPNFSITSVFFPVPLLFLLHPSLPLFLPVDRHWRVWEKPPVVSWRNLPEHRRELWVRMSHRTLSQHWWICLWRWIIHHTAHTHTVYVHWHIGSFGVILLILYYSPETLVSYSKTCFVVNLFSSGSFSFCKLVYNA